MPYIADMRKANDFVQAKKLIGNGQCVALIHALTVIPGASVWHQGELVKNNKKMAPGMIIATFDSNGRYGNHTNGTSHAAIFLYQSSNGIVVLDQWKGSVPGYDHPPQQRTIFFNRPGSEKVDQGENYYSDEAL